MTPKKSTRTPATHEDKTPAPVLSLDDMEHAADVGAEIGAAVVANSKTNGKTAPDWKESRARYDQALDALRQSQRAIDANRLAQVPHVRILRDEIARAADLFFAKGTAATIKNAAAAAYPVLTGSANRTDAIERAFLIDAGMTRATARNLLMVADRPALLALIETGIDGVKVPVSVGYELARTKGLTDADLPAACNANLTLATVKTWTAARLAARSLLDNWRVYAQSIAKRDAPDATPDDKTMANAAARSSWKDVQTGAAVPGSLDALRDMDSDVHTLLTGEIAKRQQRAADRIAKAQKELEDAQTTESELRAKTESAAQVRTALTSSVKDTNAKIRAIDEEITRKKREMERAEEDARAAIRQEIAALTDASRTAQSRLAVLQDEAKNAIQSADLSADSLAKAEKTRKDAESRLALANKAHKVETAAAPPRPVGDYDALLAVYKTMDRDSLKTEMIEIVSAVTSKGRLHILATVGRMIETDNWTGLA